MMNTVSTYAMGALAIVITFGLAVFVHEIGHMMFAIVRGVGVESFAIGMGPRMYSWKWFGIDFSLRWLPVGGFVKIKGMVGEDEEEKPEGEAGEMADAAKTEEQKAEEEKTLADSAYDDLLALRNKGLLTKLMVFGGGVFMNYVAAIIATAIYLAMPSEMAIIPSRIDRVMPGTPAERAGLLPGDVIMAVNDHPTTYSAQVTGQIRDAFKARNDRSFLKTLFGANEPVKPYDIKLAIKRDGKQFEVDFPPFTADFATTSVLGVAFWLPPVVGEVHAYLPEDKAGVKPGDRVLAVNGQKVESFNDVTEKIVASPGKPVTLELSRGGETKEITFTPIENPKAPGVALVGMLNQPPASVKVPGEPVLKSIMYAPILATLRIGDLAIVQYNFFKRATMRQVKENLGGPVMIAAMTARQASLGLKEAIDWFIMLNLVLLIFNLLPLPVLDGGFLALSVIEAVIRRPIPTKILNPIFLTFTVLLIGLMVLITFWDIQRFIK